MVNRPRGVVEVGVEALRLEHGPLQAVVNGHQPAPFVAAPGEVGQGRVHGGHPAVAVLVDTVAEAHDLSPLGQSGLEPARHRLGTREGGKYAHHRLIGPSVQRSLQRSDGPGDRGIKVGEGRGYDPGGEGRCVEAMLGIKDQRYLKTAQHLRAWDRPEAHMEEVLDERQRRVGRYRRLAPTAPLLGGDDGGQLRP